jgi:hypothetical protein
METKLNGEKKRTKKGRSTRERIRKEVNEEITQSKDDISLEEAIKTTFPKLFNLKLCPYARLKGIWGEWKQTSTDSNLDKR